jgi:glutathione S-transferase
MITLYRHPESLYCANVKWLLEELGEAYQTVNVDIAAGEHQTPRYIRLNPMQRVPFIEDDRGFSLGESNAIMRYLTQRFLAFHWYPYHLEDRALADQWLDYLATHVNKPVGELIWYTVFAHSAPNASILVTAAQKRIERELKIMDSWLLTRHYLVDAIPTIADIAGATFIAVAVQKAGLKLDNYGAVKDWLHEMTVRPAFKVLIPEIY